jgi:hypothetical protein
MFEFAKKIIAKSVGARGALRQNACLSGFSDGRYGRSGDAIMTHENNADILKKIRNLLDERLTKEQPVNVPKRPLPKPIRVWWQRSRRRVTYTMSH